jgi:hypothetical protein
MSNDPFDSAIYDGASEAERLARFRKLFDEPAPGVGQTSVVEELGTPLDEDRIAEAIAILQRLGIDPDKAKDTDWARIALALLGPEGQGDVLAAAGYGPGSRYLPLADGFDFPDFEDDLTLGLKPGRIRMLGDLYYIAEFDRLGVSRVVNELARRSFDGRFDLGDSQAGLLLYTYVKRRRLRFPEEDRRRLLGMVFGGEDGRGPFKPLMGRLVESLIDYARIQNAGELVSEAADDRSPSVYSRAAVIRAVVNMQRYLSDVGGGILRYLRDESGAALKQCFDILQSSEVQRYWGGDFKSGMWAVVEDVLTELDGRAPPIDRSRTLAVHGRRIFYWLADNTNNVETLTDGDINIVAEHVQNWISAYRRPDTAPDWLEDDDYYHGEEENGDIADEMVEEAVRDTVGEEIDEFEEADVL